jgi:hypothetical protein
MANVAWVRTRLDACEPAATLRMGLTPRRIGNGYSCFEHVKQRQHIVIVECLWFRNIPATLLTLQAFKSYDSKHFQVISPTSTTIKSETRSRSYSFLGHMRQLRKRELSPTLAPRSAHLPSPLNPVNPAQGCRQTSASTSHSPHETLSYMRVVWQETPGYRCGVGAVDEHDERRPNGNLDGGYHPTRS